MRHLLLALVALCGLVVSVEAAPKAKKYHFELAGVLPKPEVSAEHAATATPLVEAKIKDTFENHPQLVATLEGAPPKEEAVKYRKYLTKKKLAGAYLVTVEITEAEEEIEPMDKPKTQRMTVRLSIHVLGETIPGRTMGFTGDGKATIKQEIGTKVRDRDREFAWGQAVDLAVADAMTTVFKQLAVTKKAK